MPKYFKWKNIFKLVFSVCVLTVILVLYMQTLQNNGLMSQRDSLRNLYTATFKNKSNGRAPLSKLVSSEDRHMKDRHAVDYQPGTSQSSPPKPNRHGPLNVVIVEEHHEVIPYWFGAAEKGIIPKSGNTLIHIDGHNDLGPPLYLPGYPFFRWPRSAFELRYFMQRNDAFIQAAAMTGLISHSLWVWPDWDSVNHQADYVAANLSLGWFQNGEDKAFCMCEYNNTEFKCFTLHDVGNENETMPSDGFPVPAHRCNIKKQIFVEEIVESKAVELFSKKSWIDIVKNIILDIDEDYFGCTYAIQPLSDVGLKMDRILKLDKIIATIFCPRNYEQEHASNRILQEFIHNVFDTLCPSGEYSSGKCNQQTKHININNLSEKMLQSVQMAMHTFTLRLCSRIGKRLEKKVTDLVQNVVNLSAKQLQQLQIVGFCSETSPRTLIPEEVRHFGLCIGANKPNDTAVLEHRTSESEINHRSSILNPILRSIAPLSPQIATVCRSVRDGYTPREHAMRVEAKILNGLDHEIPNEMVLNYDKGLLGGEKGWYKYNKQ